MITEEFMELYKDSTWTSKTQRAEVVKRTLEEAFRQIKGVSSDAEDEEIWKEIFSSVELIKPIFGLHRSREAISFYVYRLTKIILNEFITFLEDKSIISNASEFKLFISAIKYEDVINITGLENSYFKGIESVISYIDDVGKCLYYESHRNDTPPAPNYDESVMLLDMKVISILLWHGISLENMLKLNKSDVYKSEEQCFIAFNKRQIFISEREYQIIRDYIKLEKQSHPPKFYAPKFYKKTNKLIKGSRGIPTANGLSASLKRFNSYIEKMTPFTKKITVIGLVDSNLYATIHEKAKTSKYSIYGIIKQTTGANNHVAQNQAKEYQIWKKIFYPEQ